MKEDEKYEVPNKKPLQKKDFTKDKTDAIQGEIVRSITYSVVSYTNNGEELLASRITVGQFRACNKLLQVSDEIKEKIKLGELSEEERKSAESLMHETRGLLEARDTATFRTRKGTSVDYQYQSAWRLDKAWEKIIQLERIAGAKPTP